MLEALVSMAFVQPVWSLTSIVNLILMQAILIGLCMQVILLIPLLCYVGVLSPNFLDKRRKIVFMVTLIITSFITPTGDALSEVIILCPTYLALELGILIAKTGMIKHVWK